MLKNIYKEGEMKKILYLTLLISSILFAETNTTWKDLSMRGKVTNGYHKFLNAIDCFLTNYDDINHTNYKKVSENKLYMIYSLKNSKDKPLEQDLYLRANIKLPLLKDKFEITLDKQTLSDIDNETIDPEYDRSVEDEKPRIGLKYYFYKEPYSVTYANLGLRLYSPYGIYGKVGGQKSFFLKKVQVILGQDFYIYFNDQHLASDTEMTFFYPLADYYDIEQKNRMLWRESSKTTEVDHILRLHQFINKRNRLQYQLTYSLINDDHCNFCQNWYGANIRYHHDLNDWLFVEIIPQILKRRENQFIQETALTVNFGMIFSK